MQPFPFHFFPLSVKWLQILVLFTYQTAQESERNLNLNAPAALQRG